MKPPKWVAFFYYKVPLSVNTKHNTSGLFPNFQHILSVNYTAICVFTPSLVLILLTHWNRKSVPINNLIFRKVMRRLLKSLLILSVLFSSTISSAQAPAPCSGNYISGWMNVLPNNFTVGYGQTLYVMASNSLSGGTIALEEDAKIVLGPNVTLDLFQMSIVNCDDDKLWDRIEIPTANSTLTMQACILTGSENGVYSRLGGNFQINSCDFINNQKHLNIKYYSGVHQGTVTGSTFYNAGGLIENGVDYESSIHIENIGHVTIGHINENQNHIQGGQYGIYSINSSVSIENNYIHDYKDNGDKGIFNEYGQEHIIRNNKIDWVNIGIEQNNLTSSLISDNQINPSGERAVFLKDCETTTIKYNTIKDAYNEAIEVRNMANNYPIHINYNKISGGDVGIMAQSAISGTLTLPDIYIKANDIFHTRIGIYGKHLKTLHAIKANNIFFQQTGLTQATQGIGIYLEKSWYTVMAENYIEDWSDLSPSTNGTGILLEQSENTTVYRNKVVGAKEGIAYTHSFSGVNIECNTLEDCYNGFYFDNNATNASNPFEVIGDDISGVSSGNKWIGISNYRINNESNVDLDWYFSTQGNQYSPSPFFGNINDIPSSSNPSCYPAPRLAQAEYAYKLYPNPTKGDLFIEFDQEYGKLELFNMMGQKILEKEITEGVNNLNLNHLPQGIYHSKLSSYNTSLKVDKLLITR